LALAMAFALSSGIAPGKRVSARVAIGASCYKKR
jgi:hypothetical protein